MTLAAIQESVIRLPSNEKVALIDLLWDSLDPEVVAKIQQRWANESEDRIDAFDRGELPAVDGPSAIQGIRQTFQISVPAVAAGASGIELLS